MEHKKAVETILRHTKTLKNEIFVEANKQNITEEIHPGADSVFN